MFFCRDREDRYLTEHIVFLILGDFGKGGEEEMKLGRTEMSQGGLGVSDQKALSSCFLANVCAMDVNMCKVFFLRKDSSSVFLEVGSQRKCC